MFSPLIRYFRDCYEADNRRATIWNIFKESVEHRLFFEGEEELLNGELPHAPIDPDRGMRAMEAAHVYRKEKDLLYCSLFIVGRLEDAEGNVQLLCAPLLLHPAEFVHRPPHVYVRPDLQDRRVNHLLLKRLQPSTEEGSLYERLASVLAYEHLTSDRILDVAALLEATVPNLDVGPLYDYPSLVAERALRGLFGGARQGAISSLRVAPASCIALVRKSVETRGVLNELAALAEAERLSKPLRVLFGGALNAGDASKNVAVGRVPAVLSAAQEGVLRQAATTPVTLVIGPPGTGKSYTISALALEHLSRGQTVLIASKMNHAVDVVGAKIEQKLQGETVVVRGGRRHYLRDLKRYLKELLSGMHTAELIPVRQQRGLERIIGKLDRGIADLERRIEKQNQREIAWGHVLAQDEAGVFSPLKGRLVRWRARRAVPLWHLIDQLEKQLQARIIALTDLIRMANRGRLAHLLRTQRAALTTFSKAIRARTGSRQEDLFGTLDFEAVLRAFPVWLVNLADVHKVLPLQGEQFDLAIIDEATQCDIASCLPLLQRARRVVITGDPNQLRHISFLAKDRQRALFEKHQLPPEQADRYDYREKSILDLVNERITTQEHVVFLNEHFRSAPSIIAFSNETFYAGALRVMTERPGREGPHPVTLLPCEGRRDPDGRNMEEAHRLLDDVARLVQEQDGLSLDLAHSIGILSPFRSQVDYLAQQLSGVLSVEALEKHDVLVGTAHTFQGEERDVMFLSLVVDPASHPATLRFLNRPDVFNVAITRARIGQRLYFSCEASPAPNDSLLHSYLRAVKRRAEERGARQQGGRLPVGGGTGEVRQALEERGLRTWAAYPIAGLTMDLVAANEQHSCGIDLIGFPGPFEHAFPLERYKMFFRAGLKLIPLPYTKWLMDRAGCLDAIEKAIRPMG